MDARAFGRAFSRTRVRARPSRASPPRDHRSDSIESRMHRIESNRIESRVVSSLSHRTSMAERIAPPRARASASARMVTLSRASRREDTRGDRRMDHSFDAMGTVGFYAITRSGSRDV